jgi:hypothetical protein
VRVRAYLTPRALLASQAKWLLEKGAAVDMPRTCDGRTALFDATTKAHPELVKLLVRLCMQQPLRT